MVSRCLLLALLGFASAAARAQAPLRPAHFPRYAASPLLRADQLLGSAVPPAAAVAPVPTVRAAAAYGPLPRPASPPLPADAPPPPPSHDLTGVRGAPPYDLYQGWPEAQRKYTLPAPWIEPLPLQLLRGALGR